MAPEADVTIKILQQQRYITLKSSTRSNVASQMTILSIHSALLQYGKRRYKWHWALARSY